MKSIIFLLLLSVTGTAWAQSPALDGIQNMVARGEFQQALEALEPIIRNQPGNPDARFLRGVVYAQLGDVERAIAIFTALTREFSDLSEPYNNLAVLHAWRREYDKAQIGRAHV